MAEKIKQNVPWFLVLSLICGVSMIVFNLNQPFNLEVNADTATTSVVVGNAAPTWVAVYENPESSSSTPTNAGQNITFEGRADDPNSESWFLVICSTSTSIATSSEGACPTCPGGTHFASSTAADNATATATYTTSSGDSEQNDWWAWACDSNSDQKCAAVSQGTGGSANLYSPFVVNHAPGFTAQENSGPVEPGASVSFNASSTDTDSYGGADTLTFAVCKTSGVSGTWCDGGDSDTWCTTTAASDPNCSANAPDPSEGAQNYYIYIFDNHGFAATGAIQGAEQSFTVSNVAPIVENVELNGEASISLAGLYAPDGNKDIFAIANITDHNGCADVATITVKAYPTGVGAGGCSSQDNNNCYYNISCSAGPCQGNGYTATTSCTINFKYHADPTDAATPRADETWKATITAEDEALSDSEEASTGVELVSNVALFVTTAINYGTLSIGEISDATNLPQTVTATTSGNTGIDVEVSGTQMCTDFPTCSGSIIATSSQKYATSTVQYGDALAYTLLTADTELEINCPKTTVTATPETKDIYWGLQIPEGTGAGSYNGQNNFTAVKAETVDW